MFAKINKIDKALDRLIKKKEKKREREKGFKLAKLELKKRGCNRKCRNTKNYETIMNTNIAIKWITWKKWTDS